RGSTPRRDKFAKNERRCHPRTARWDEFQEVAQASVELPGKFRPRTLSAESQSVLQETDLRSRFRAAAVSERPRRGRPGALVELRLLGRRLSPRCRARKYRSRARSLPMPQCDLL